MKRVASIGTLACTEVNSVVDCPSVHVVIHLNGTFTPFLVQNRSSWAPYKFDFVATSTSTEVWQQVPQYINNFGLFQLSEAVFIDGETAFLVPEPSIFALALMALALMFRRRLAA